MAHFPVFLDLNGALVFLVGEDPRKEEILRSFGAQVRLLPELTEENLKESPKLVVLTGGDRKKMAAMCRRQNIPVNSVDDPENSTFFFPSVIQRGDTTIAISSGGKAPAAAKALRIRIEQALPENLEQLLPWLAELTVQLRIQIPDYAARSELLERITQAAFSKNRPLTPEEITLL